MIEDTGPGSNGVRALTVCLVDDDPLIRSLFSRVIQRAGCDVVTAAGANEAETLLGQHQVQLLLSDLRMPEAIDGESLLIKVKQDYPNLPICMMSGDWCPETQARMMAFGASACIIKPFTTDSFRSLIDQLNGQSMDPVTSRAGAL